MNNTGAQNENALHLIAGNVYIGDDKASALDYGAVENVNITVEKGGLLKESDNRGEIVNLVRETAVITFDWLEPRDMARIENALKGLQTKTIVAGTPVTGATQDIEASTVALGDFIEIANQNGDGSAITINSVTQDPDGTPATLTANTDYILTKNSQGEYGIALVSESSADVTKKITIDYDYTPNASVQLEGGGGLKAATYRFMRIEGVDPDGKALDVELDECSLDGDWTFPFLEAEKAGDIGKMSLSFRMKKGTKYRIYDEKNV